METVILRLYVTGRDPVAEGIITKLRAYLARTPATPSELQVIDVLESPELAESHRILATPTLVKESPSPVRKAIGDFSDIDRIARFLGLSEAESNGQAEAKRSGK